MKKLSEFVKFLNFVKMILYRLKGKVFQLKTSLKEKLANFNFEAS